MSKPSNPSGFGDGHLEQFCEDIWTASAPIRFAGTWFSHVMTVVRLADGDLLVHSPCRPSGELLEQLAGLGNVAHVVAPNWFHDLYLARYRELYRNALFWGPARLRRYIDRSIDSATATPWSQEMPHFCLSGLLTFDESIFFHRRTRTLIVADLLTNSRAGADSPALTRFAYRLLGLDGRVKVFPILQLFGFGRARAALRRVAEQITAWAPERLIVAHGAPIEQITLTQLQEAF